MRSETTRKKVDEEMGNVGGSVLKLFGEETISGEGLLEPSWDRKINSKNKKTDQDRGARGVEKIRDPPVEAAL